MGKKKHQNKQKKELLLKITKIKEILLIKFWSIDRAVNNLVPRMWMKKSLNG